MAFRFYQSDTIVRNVLRYVSQTGAKSLLDIGAGSTVPALSLSHNVARYLAVEADHNRANALREAGLEVISRRFPTKIPETFDLVLSSHSIPELSEQSLEDYPPFLEAAWDRLAIGGLLLIVTYKGSAGDLAAVTSELFANSDAPNRDNGSREFAVVMDKLSELGRPRVERVNSYAIAEYPDEIVSYFAPWIRSTMRLMSPEVREHFKDVVEARYCVRSNLYLFPTEHLFISCKRG